MNNRYLKKIITVLSCAALAALFIIALFFSAPTIATVPETTGKISVPTGEYIQNPDGAFVPVYDDYVIGKDITAVRISDLTECGAITKVNYVPNKFVKLRELNEDYQIVDLTEPFEFAEKGTLMFAVINLDPFADDFDYSAEKLAPHKIGDKWEFTFCLPKIFNASNVYCNHELISRHGEIKGYNFNDFNEIDTRTTDKFLTETATDYIDLKFSTRRETISSYFAAVAIVTVHYQASGGMYSGINDLPLIGTDSAVTGVNRTSQNLLLLFAVIAAVVLAVLVVLSIVERSKEFISAIVWIFGITVILLCRYILSGITGAPHWWIGVALAMPFAILGGAQLAIGRNFGKIPTKYLFPAVSAVGALFAFICPYIPFGACKAMNLVCIVLKSVGAAALTTFIGFALADKNDAHSVFKTVCTSIIDVGIVASLFLPRILPVWVNPLFWLSAATTLLTFVSVVIVIMDMKKANVYLTENLHKEVDRQVKDIKAVIAERDNLLQFVSHDMKKPLLSAATLLDTTIEREKDAEQIKALEIIKQQGMRVVYNLSDIGEYAHFNYIAESSQVTDLSELCALLYKYHKLDCDANGIILKNTADGHAMAFVKKQGLENVVSNIMINAVEHANCKTITLSIKINKNKIVLCVADDGKGLREDIDVFAPYTTEKKEKEKISGLGLYICKSIVESMNGELSYETGQNGTTFFISLLKA